MTQRFVFHRPELAGQLCDALQGGGLLEAGSGLFLAAPRRTGKTFFLTEDFLPECVARGWEPVYVDLWSDQEADPAALIRRAVIHALDRHRSALAALVKRARTVRIGVLRAVALELEGAAPAETPLVDLVDTLFRLAQRPVVLVIDEAQQASVSAEGVRALHALKSARDQINNAGADMRLFLVCTGSSRDKLAHLVLNRHQAFFGATVTPFPYLGAEFARAYTAWVNALLSPEQRYSEQAVAQAFARVGYRPEMLREAAQGAVFDDDLQALAPDTRLLTRAARVVEARLNDILAELDLLTPLARHLLAQMLEEGERFTPFAEASLAGYATALGEERVGQSRVQKTLEGLREKGLVWKPQRGLYRLEDSARDALQLRADSRESPGEGGVGSD